MNRHAGIRDRLLRVLAVAALCGSASAWGQQGGPGFNLNVVYLDPAHGGDDPGAHLTSSLAEKEVTLALAGRVKAALVAKGFTVFATRDADTGLTSEQRADVMNHARPVACLLLHATNSGTGAFLAASGLAPDDQPRAALPWATAQGAYVSQSLVLLNGVVGALGPAGLKPVMLRASVPPIDSLTCPAIVVEVAPNGGVAVTDAGYQTKLAEALASAMESWRTQVTPVKETPPEVDPGKTPASPAVPAGPKIRLPSPPRPVVPPVAPRPSLRPGTAAPADRDRTSPERSER